MDLVWTSRLVQFAAGAALTVSIGCTADGPDGSSDTDPEDSADTFSSSTTANPWSPDSPWPDCGGTCCYYNDAAQCCSYDDSCTPVWCDTDLACPADAQCDVDAGICRPCRDGECRPEAIGACEDDVEISQTRIATRSSVEAVALLQADGDPALELAVRGPSNLWVYAEVAQGVEAGFVELPDATDPGDLVALDLDGDGIDELVSHDAGAGTHVAAMQSEGYRPTQYLEAGDLLDLVALDVDADGSWELGARLDGSVAVLGGAGGTVEVSQDAAFAGLWSIVAVPAASGHDLALVDDERVLLLDGENLGAEPVEVGLANEALGDLTAGDLDADGTSELFGITDQLGQAQLWIWRGPAAGPFEVSTLVVPVGAFAVEAADVDGDGAAEIVAYGAGGVSVISLRGQDPCYWRTVWGSSDRVVAGDVDGDGDEELISVGAEGMLLVDF